MTRWSIFLQIMNQFYKWGGKQAQNDGERFVMVPLCITTRTLFEKWKRRLLRRNNVIQTFWNEFLSPSAGGFFHIKFTANQMQRICGQMAAREIRQ